MKQVYYSFLPEGYQRPGGVWWTKVLADFEIEPFLSAIVPVACHVRVSSKITEHDRMHISPPIDSKIIK